MDSLAREWAEALRGQGLSAQDLEELDEARIVLFIRAYRGIDHHAK